MKKLTILLVIIFTFLFSTTCWGDWSFVSINSDGDKFYYEKEGVKKSGKFLYFWLLLDTIKPTENGDLSYTAYIQLHCIIMRNKMLKLHSYNKSMGKGEITSSTTPEDEWEYPPPGTTFNIAFNEICGEQM